MPSVRAVVELASILTILASDATAARAVLDQLDALPSVPIAPDPTPIEDLSRLRDALGGGPRLLVKRDDAIAFAFGGNKVRKMRLVAAEAQAGGADALITCGGIQSNHARVTAAMAARLGMRCVLIANGEPPAIPTANALLDRLAGADIRYVRARADRAPAMDAAAEELRSRGARPFIVPLGASTPLGAAAYAQAVGELLTQIEPPDVIIHATSSGGTQAGLVAGCVLHGIHTRIIGVSADDPRAAIEGVVRGILGGIQERLRLASAAFSSARIEVDDTFVGDGYGIPTAASEEAIALCARSEGLFLDPTYTAKAMAGLIARVRDRRLGADRTVLFWHTGGQVGLFA